MASRKLRDRAGSLLVECMAAALIAHNYLYYVRPFFG